MAGHVDIIFADGTSQRFPVEGAEVTVGSSPKAGIRIDEAALEAEHLLLAPQGEGCWVGVAQGVKAPAYVDGTAFTQGTVPWGTSISVGPITIRLVGETREAAKASAVSLPILLLALVGLPLGLWMMFSAPEGFDLPERSAKAPELFSDVEPCPKRGEPSNVAEELGSAALAKAERYAFDPGDGIEAVGLYRQAASCMSKAGQGQLAKRLEDAAASLRGSVEEDYKTHRVRLRRALENKRYDDVEVEARALLSFVGAQGDYSEWLRMLVRRIEMRGTKKK